MDGTTAALKEKFADHHGDWGPDQAGLKNKAFLAFRGAEQGFRGNTRRARKTAISEP